MNSCLLKKVSKNNWNHNSASRHRQKRLLCAIYFIFLFFTKTTSFVLCRQRNVCCLGCWRCQQKEESLQRSGAGGAGVRGDSVRGWALRPGREAAPPGERAHLGGNPGEGQRCVQSPPHPAGGEEAVGWPEETQRWKVGRCSPPQLLPALQQRGFVTRKTFSVAVEPSASTGKAEAELQTKG